MVRPALLLSTFLILASCGSLRAVDRPLSTATLSSHLNRLAVPLEQEDHAARDRMATYVVERLESAGWQPALRESFRLQGSEESASVGPEAHVLAYLPGRDATLVDRLVLLTTDLNSAGAAALLETARLLAFESLDGIHPRASVAVGFWLPSERGAEDFIRNPTWSLDAVDRVMMVTLDTTAVAETRAAWARAGIPMEVVTVEAAPDTSATVATVFRLAETSLAAARRTAARVEIPASEPAQQ